MSVPLFSLCLRCCFPDLLPFHSFMAHGGVWVEGEMIGGIIRAWYQEPPALWSDICARNLAASWDVWAASRIKCLQLSGEDQIAINWYGQHNYFPFKARLICSHCLSLEQMFWISFTQNSAPREQSGYPKLGADTKVLQQQRPCSHLRKSVFLLATSWEVFLFIRGAI